MRLRDRQALLAALLLCAAYAALLLWAVLQARFIATGVPVAPASPGLSLLLKINAALLVWRLGVRASFVTAAYGWREGLRSIPRTVVSNMVAMLAARRAVARYLSVRRTGTMRWDKTAHAFPIRLPAE